MRKLRGVCCLAILLLAGVVQRAGAAGDYCQVNTVKCNRCNGAPCVGVYTDGRHVCVPKDILSEQIAQGTCGTPAAMGALKSGKVFTSAGVDYCIYNYKTQECYIAYKIKPPTSFPCEVKIDGKVVKTLKAATREACYKLIGFGSENCKTYAQYLKPPPSKSFLEQYFKGTDRLSSEYCNWTCTLSSSQK